jgi:hypothetical protein
MALSPSTSRLVKQAKARFGNDSSPASTGSGIILLVPVEISDRDMLVFDIAEMISEALTGPAIHATHLAEKIVDLVAGELFHPCRHSS